MSKLCLSTYLSVLTLYKRTIRTGQFKILNGLVKSICSNPDIIDKELVSHIKNGRRNLPQVIIDELEEKHYQNPHYFEFFKSNVEINLHPEKTTDICKVLKYIASHDERIDDSSVIDYISHDKKSDFDHIGDPVSYIAGVFLYVIQFQNDETADYAKEITEEFCKSAVNEYDAKIFTSAANTNSELRNNIIDTDIPSQAKSFCRRHEDSIGLLPLCQIANIVNPAHNHVNKMYDEYCDCSETLKKQILKENNCPMIHADDEYALYGLLSRFADDIETMELASKDKTYMFWQYVVRSLDYEELEPLDINPSFFPIAPSRIMPDRNTSVLSQFIGDYLFYKDKDMNISLPVPLDWMWANLNFGSCAERDLIFWLNLFIISSCYDVQAYFKYNNNESLSIPNITDTKTIEDLFFLSLLMLYDTYMNS